MRYLTFQGCSTLANILPYMRMVVVTFPILHGVNPHVIGASALVYLAELDAISRARVAHTGMCDTDSSPFRDKTSFARATLIDVCGNLSLFI
jgi:hypothetical protein